MADANYPIPTNPVYDSNIRALQNDDFGNAVNTFNPLFQQIINNVEAVKLEASAALSGGDNLLTNPGFETSSGAAFPPWDVRVTSGRGSVNADAATKRSGAQSLHWNITAAWPGIQAFQLLDISKYPDGTTLEFSVWIKRTGAAASQSVTVMLGYYGGDNANENKTLGNVGEGWFNAVYRFRLNKAAHGNPTRFKAGIMYDNSAAGGDLWIDDASLRVAAGEPVNYMFFGPVKQGDGSGSSWQNAAAFNSAAYDAMPANTAALLLGSPTKYNLSSSITVTSGKPIIGGHTGHGLERVDCAVTNADDNWANVTFSPWATVFDGGGAAVRFTVNPGALLDNVAVGNCSNTTYGGGISSRGTVSNCLVANCKVTGATTFGGGIYGETGAVVTNCKVCNCSGPRGGGIYAAANAIVTDCEARNCSASNGGGIYGSASSVVDRCQVCGCAASNNGGGIYSAARVANCSVKRCLSTMQNDDEYPYGGGGIYLESFAGAASKCEVSDCQAAQGAGGGVNGGQNIADCVITGCYAKIGGGAHVRTDGRADNCLISNCCAPTSPGVGGPGTLTNVKQWNNTTTLQ